MTIIEHASVSKYISDQKADVIKRLKKHLKGNIKVLIDFLYSKSCVFCQLNMIHTCSVCARCVEFINGLDEEEAIALSILCWEEGYVVVDNARYSTRHVIKVWLSLKKNKRKVFGVML